MRIVRATLTRRYFPAMHPAEAARRVARYEATLDPRVLWPGVTEAQFADATREIVRVTTALLPDPAAVEWIVTPVPGGADAFGVAAFASGLGPLLGFWIETRRLRAPGELDPVLAEHLDHGRRRATRLWAELERIVELLGREDIPVTVLKGMHTAWAYFPEPGTRPSGDIDVLIPADRESDAARLLEAAGFRRAYSMAQRSTWNPPDWTPPASVRLTHADNPWTLDLHVTLDRRFADADDLARFGLRPEEDLREWNAGPPSARVLAQPLLACFLAVHATQHFPYVSALRVAELALVFARDGGVAFPWRALRHRLYTTGIGPLAYPALKLTADLVSGSVPSALLVELRQGVPSRARALADRLTPATAHQLYRRSLESRFMWTAPGWRRVTAVVRWLWPRDSDGARLPLAEAIRVTGRRLCRLMGGRLSWRHR